MKLLLKIVKILAIIIIILIIALFSVTLVKQEKVAALFLNELNENINTKIEVGSLKLSLFRKFPMASFEFKNILIHSSPGFNKNQFESVNTDTLLFAGILSLEFKMTDLYNGRYIIESVNVVRGKMSLLSDSSGRVNYEITTDSITASGNEFALNLKNIGFSDVEVFYYNKAINLRIKSKLKTGNLRGEISDNNIDLYAMSDAEISNFQFYENFVKQPTQIRFEINMHKSDSGILINKGTFSFENIRLAISGTISDKNILDLTLSGQSTDISGLKNYLSGRYLSLFDDYQPSGLLKVDCKIAGLVGRTEMPHFNINFTVNNGVIDNIKSKLSADNISFAGSFNNGIKNDPSTSNLIINHFTFRLGTSNYTGSFALQNILHPQIDLFLNGVLIFNDLKDFISLPQISSSQGSIGISLRLSGNLEAKDKYSFSDFLKLNPEANLNFNSFSIGLNNEKLKLDDIDGNIKFLKNLWTDNLLITYKEQRIEINGEFSNLPEWLAGQSVVLKATADLLFSRLNPSNFIERYKPDNSVNESNRTIVLPRDLILDFNFIVDNFEYKSFSARNVAGRMTVNPGIIEINNFTFSGLSGNISGNCFITQSSNESFITKGAFDLNQIDIRQAFKTFKGFGQTYLKAENLGGSLSGSFTILSRLDSLMKPDLNSLVVDGAYSLINGELVNFDPVKELSSYIELSELENIKFSKLENEFFIRNSTLTIPQMDINSSAADLSINGKHNFNGDYEYHVKILLSELLSKKRRNSKKINVASSDFGAIKDDGLGRTSLLLKITQSGADFKVGYDIEAAKGALKQDLKTEKQSLKTILNEEYGWFKKDTVIKPQPKPASQTPRFRIVWEEADTIN
jgi:hypothetical protein